jgi:hypothetical protein
MCCLLFPDKVSLSLSLSLLADVMALTWKKKTPLQKAVYTYQTDCIKV